jgi:hypothetical protein
MRDNKCQQTKQNACPSTVEQVVCWPGSKSARRRVQLALHQPRGPQHSTSTSSQQESTCWTNSAAAGDVMQCRTSYFHLGHHSQVQAYLQYMCNDIAACLFPCHVYHACDDHQLLVTVRHVACIQLQANPDCQSAMVTWIHNLIMSAKPGPMPPCNSLHCCCLLIH